MATNKDVKVEQNPENPVEDGILAKAILDVSSAIVKLQKSGLNESAILALVKDYNGTPKAVTKRVLDALACLRSQYCR